MKSLCLAWYLNSLFVACSVNKRAKLKQGYSAQVWLICAHSSVPETKLRSMPTTLQIPHKLPSPEQENHVKHFKAKWKLAANQNARSTSNNVNIVSQNVDQNLDF